MTVPPTNAARADVLLAAPVGRRLGAEMAGVRFSDLLDALALPYPPNIAHFGSGSSGRTRRRRRRVFGGCITIDPFHREDRAHRQLVAAHERAVESTRPEDASAAIQRILAVDRQPLRVDARDAGAVMEALSHAVLSFGFWGNEKEHDHLLRAGLDGVRPVAESLVSSPATGWWWDDHLRDDQRYAARTSSGETGPPRGDEVASQVTRAVEALRRSEADSKRRHRSPRAVPENLSGDWWSIPIPGFWTSRSVPPVPAFHLACAEERSNEPVTVWSLRIEAAARVFEVREPSDWGRLVEIAPIDVTMSRLGDWRRWTGQEGPFYLPDWSVVAERFDGVHVSVGGYLSTRSVPVPVADGWSVLAGWDPDATLWLRDVTGAERVGEWEGPFSFDSDGPDPPRGGYAAGSFGP